MAGELMERTAAAVGCSHCRRLGATETCPVCHRPVCARCTDPTTCDAPSALARRLGIGRRLWQVDAEGRIGLVASWTGRRQWLVELASLAVVRELPSLVSARVGDRSRSLLLWPQLGPDGLLVHVGYGSGQGLFLGLGSVSKARIARIKLAGYSISDMQLSPDGRYVVVRLGLYGERVAIIDLRKQRILQTVELATQVQSLALSSRFDLLAIGQWERLRFHRLSSGSYLGTLHVGTGDVAAIEFARDRIAAATDTGICRVMLVDPATTPEEWPELCNLRLSFGSTLSLAHGDSPQRRRVRIALSSDGLLLAARQRRRELVVARLPRAELRELPAVHTDRINLVRFAGDRLVTADLDNRVVLWPRRGPDLVRQVVTGPRRRR